MKSKNITIDDIIKIHKHPASVLFRTIELKAIHNICCNIDFKSPSIDIGCADGKISNLLFDSKFTYGLDNGEVDDYKDAIKNDVFKKVYIQSATNMDLKNNSVNFAFSNSVLEHIKDVDSVLNETYRILNTGGYFVFTVPSIYFYNFLHFKDPFTKFYSNKLNKKLNHYHLYESKKWILKLKNAGFKKIEFSYYLDKKTLFFWNLLMFLSLIFSQSFILKMFSTKINDFINNSKMSMDKGACLVFVCEK